MLIYEPSPEHDRLLRQWWARMVQDGEVERTLGSVQTCDQLIEGMQQPTTIFMEVDDDGPWFVSWVVPSGMLGAAFFNLWVRPDQRHQHAVASIYFVMKCVMKVFQVALVVTNQDRLAANSIRFGFTFLGDIPELFGEKVHVLYYTRSAFEHVAKKVEDTLATEH